ncbi:MAG: hypothetical protein DMG67_07470 [Acidobacteria bacterium]|nr:MAG: hypothetical protein DMG67_07470 [Acidobacteriota bacterium]
MSGDTRTTKKLHKNRISRRTFMKTASMAAGALCLGGCAEMQNSSSTPPPVISKPEGIAVNDIHSQLNSTFVHEVLKPASVEVCRLIIQKACDQGRVISVAGGRHSMGGQQFADGALLMDTRSLNRVLDFDRNQGVLNVEAGI